MTLAGIDVSAIGQGTAFDWVPYKGKIAFAYAKATEGTGFADPAFTRNYAQMRAEGIVPGAYHFLRPALDAIEQARHFLAVARPQPGDLMMLDVEVADGRSVAEVAKCAHDFCMEVRRVTRAWPACYTDISMAEAGYLAACSACPGWIANPSGRVLPSPIGPWHVVSFEQTGMRGVDTDVFHGTPAQLAALTVPHPAPPVTTPPPPKPVAVTRAQAESALATLAAYVAQG